MILDGPALTQAVGHRITDLLRSLNHAKPGEPARDGPVVMTVKVVASRDGKTLASESLVAVVESKGMA